MRRPTSLVPLRLERPSARRSAGLLAIVCGYASMVVAATEVGCNGGSKPATDTAPDAATAIDSSVATTPTDAGALVDSAITDVRESGVLPGDASCTPDGGPAESPCTSSSECLCPARCRGGLCIPGCATAQDCPVGSSCVGSQCTSVGCGPLAPAGVNGSYGGPCHASGGDASDGICLPVEGLGAGVSPDCQFGWVCIPSGTATTTCLVSTSTGMNPPAAQTCATGTACYSTTGTTGICTPSCGPVDGGSCPPQSLATCSTDAGFDAD